jgi:uncharacterized protein (TIGR02231 family)
MPELDPKVFLRCVATNTAPSPMLAGPVELVRDNGSVGWTSTLFVAPRERFELSFGPDDDLRVVRRAEAEKTEIHPVDKFREVTHDVRLYLSNLGGTERELAITERLPISELEQVQVVLDDDKTTGSPERDDNGFISWKVTLPPHGRSQLRLKWMLRIAPDVEGL